MNIHIVFTNHHDPEVTAIYLSREDADLHAAATNGYVQSVTTSTLPDKIRQGYKAYRVAIYSHLKPNLYNTKDSAWTTDEVKNCDDNYVLSAPGMSFQYWVWARSEAEAIELAKKARVP